MNYTTTCYMGWVMWMGILLAKCSAVIGPRKLTGWVSNDTRNAIDGVGGHTFSYLDCICVH